MKGKWAAGIPPRNLTWVLPNILAVSERPGGQAATHRKVRRQEEIIWLRENGFDVVISVLTSPQNLAAYADLSVDSVHLPVPTAGDMVPALVTLYGEIAARQGAGQQMLVHADELGDFAVGIVAGYLLWVGRLEGTPQATSVAEQLFGRQLGSEGRAIVATVAELKGR
jgi:hypothetical protein